LQIAKYWGEVKKDYANYIVLFVSLNDYLTEIPTGNSAMTFLA
jgi:hypothetical protein